MLRARIRNSIRSYPLKPSGGFVGLLDTYGGAAAAYSFRRLSSTYTGNLIEVRRSSDNTIQDIGYDENGDLDTASLLSFVGAGDGFVRTWYDQSANGNDATQTTTTNQPQIVSSGSLITNNGYQVIKYDGTNDNLSASFTATGTMLMGGSDGSAFYEVAISGAYNFLSSASSTDHALNETTRIIWDRTLSAGEQSDIESIVTYTDWDFSDVTNFTNYWRLRSELTLFPLIDTSSGTNFNIAWFGCSSLTSLPLLDVSSGTSFGSAWSDCSSLTSFPSLNVSSGTNFAYAWKDCSSLTSFPLLNVSNGTSFVNSWFRCSSLQDFPANMFDSVTATNFTLAFTITNLTQTSIDNILVSLDTAGQSNGTFNQSGGSAPSATGEAAIDNLRSRGWTVTVTGGY